MLFFYSAIDSQYIWCEEHSNRSAFIVSLDTLNRRYDFTTPWKEVPQSCVKKLYPNVTWYDGTHIFKPTERRTNNE